jgi:hypothetical protein
MIPIDYESVAQIKSEICPGVSYRIARMSFGRRIELMRLVRDATIKLEFQEAAGETSQMEAAILSSEVDRLYVRWALKAIDGLLIDGLPATPEILVLDGPEELLQEVLTLVRAECGLSDAEKKT